MEFEEKWLRVGRFLARFNSLSFTNIVLSSLSRALYHILGVS